MKITETEKHLTKLMPELSRSNSISCLNFIYSEKNNLHVTNLDCSLVLKNTGTPWGKCINREMFKKTKSISQSIDENEIDFSEYPIIKWGIEKAVELKSTDFLIAAQDVKQFVSNDYTTRVSLTGVNVSFKDSEVCGTDGHRAGINKFEYSYNTESISETKLHQNIKDLEFILSVQAVTHLNYIIENFEVKIYVDNSQILAIGPDIQYSHKLIEGPYPNYKRTIPTDFKTEISVDKNQCAELMAGLKAIMPHTQTQTRKISMQGNRIVSNNGENPKHIDLSFEFSKKTGFNCFYMLEIVKNFAPFTFKANGPIGATLFQNGDKLRVLMPLRQLEGEENNSIGEKIDFEIKKPKNKTRTAAMVINIIKKNKNLTGAEILNILAKENQ